MARPPTILSHGSSIKAATKTVKTTRSSTATPAPKIMPHSRCRGRNPRHAIAMTTALSPESRMLIHMICSRATQKAAWPTSLQPLVTMPSHVVESAICAIEPTERPFLALRAPAGILDVGPLVKLIYRGNPTRDQRAKTPREAISASSDDFVAGKELSDFLMRCIDCVRAVY